MRVILMIVILMIVILMIVIAHLHDLFKQMS